MNKLTHYFSRLPYVHHAFGVESSHSIYPELALILPKKNFSYIVHKQYESLKIDDVRMIRSLQSEKTIKASLFVLEFTVINKEAQNALLKILEEPRPNTYFILVFPSLKKLLPTLQSRIHIVARDQTRDVVIKNRLSAVLFINQDLENRFIFIKELTDKKKEPLKKSELLQFLDELEIILSNNNTDKNTILFESIFEARNSLSSNGSSHKMILEMLAIVL